MSVPVEDHRKIAQRLGIYAFDEDVGPGLPLWLPNGVVVLEELERLAREKEDLAGYLRVRTPHVCKEGLYEQTGHLPYYADGMFPAMEHDGVRYRLKPMNCPHHHKIFASQPRTYRDLPLRLAEYGTVYRYEDSGALFGIMRTRMMQMNDAHIYCTLDQFEREFLAVCQMYLEYFRIFGIEKYAMRLSTHDQDGLGKKYVDDPGKWAATEDMVRRALRNGGIEAAEAPGEAAFYGPKIDVQVWSAIGREFTLATNQVDFAIPARMGLGYVTPAGTREVPLCIHRAPLGTHERLVGFLLEHFEGNLPPWLCPVQVRVLSISEKQAGAARDVKAMLPGMRVEVDDGGDRISAKIQRAEAERVPYVLVVGNREAQEGSVSVRVRGEGNLGTTTLRGFEMRARAVIAERKIKC